MREYVVYTNWSIYLQTPQSYPNPYQSCIRPIFETFLDYFLLIIAKFSNRKKMKVNVCLWNFFYHFLQFFKIEIRRRNCVQESYGITGSRAVCEFFSVKNFATTSWRNITEIVNMAVSITNEATQRIWDDISKLLSVVL